MQFIACFLSIAIWLLQRVLADDFDYPEPIFYTGYVTWSQTTTTKPDGKVLWLRILEDVATSWDPLSGMLTFRSISGIRFRILYVETRGLTQIFYNNVLGEEPISVKFPKANRLLLCKEPFPPSLYRYVELLFRAKFSMLRLDSVLTGHDCSLWSVKARLPERVQSGLNLLKAVFNRGDDLASNYNFGDGAKGEEDQNSSNFPDPADCAIIS